MSIDDIDNKCPNAVSFGIDKPAPSTGRSRAEELRALAAQRLSGNSRTDEIRATAAQRLTGAREGADWAGTIPTNIILTDGEKKILEAICALGKFSTEKKILEAICVLGSLIAGNNDGNYPEIDRLSKLGLLGFESEGETRTRSGRGRGDGHFVWRPAPAARAWLQTCRGATEPPAGRSRAEELRALAAMRISSTPPDAPPLPESPEKEGGSHDA